MSETKQTEGSPPDQINNARTGYQVAIEMWGQMGQEVWAKFNVMLVANSIVIAVVAQAFTSQHALPTFIRLLPVVGIILCLLWFIMMKRSFDYQIYYLHSARELEDQYFAGTMKTLSRGETFANGKEISIQTGHGRILLRMSFWSRLRPSRSVSYIVIILFVIVYFLMLPNVVG